MSIEITHIEGQAKGIFAGGLIIENKPIGFPQDGGDQAPYSNLFYWANAWSENGGLIGEHPHKMFEIMSFIIEGEIQHYDSKFDRWISLNEGDVQIIRSGSGITHAERLMEKSRMFQIWFDPNIKKTKDHEASYNDYRSNEFHVSEVNGIKKVHYVGKQGMIEMESEGVEISTLLFKPKQYHVEQEKDVIYSYYVLNGSAILNGNEIKEHDFIRIMGEQRINLQVKKDTKLFEVIVPVRPSYQTYLELINN